ncbi:MAG TPA: hypothetical protein VMU34_15225 [Mycobacterium sp.]|nr:hypothetical protein [Mycobacterium sp.]
MTVSAATDQWATSDHDPLSITEPITTAATKTVVARCVSGAVIAEYPDFTPGTPARVLPAIVSNAPRTDRPIIDDNQTLVGPTRRSEFATIDHDRDHVTVPIERDRRRVRPAN